MDVQTLRKKRRLNYNKCTFCRTAHEKCLPVTRQWPNRCIRCEERDLDCSAPVTCKAGGFERCKTAVDQRRTIDENQPRSSDWYEAELSRRDGIIASQAKELAMTRDISEDYVFNASRIRGILNHLDHRGNYEALDEILGAIVALYNGVRFSGPWHNDWSLKENLFRVAAGFEARLLDQIEHNGHFGLAMEIVWRVPTLINHTFEPYKKTMLMWAAKEDHCFDLEDLLGIFPEPAEVNARDAKGRTALWHAVYQRNVRIVGMLLDIAEIDPNISDEKGNTPLHLAISNDSIEVAELLMNCPLTRCLDNGQGDSPLSTALKLPASANKAKLTDMLATWYRRLIEP